MPELFRFFGIKFFFFSREHLPIHIHIRNAEGHAKYEIDPVIKLVENNGIKAKELRLAKKIITENKEQIIIRWREYHGDY